MRNILMGVTICDPVVRNLGIDKNWNRLDYPSVFILSSTFFLYVEYLFCKPQFPALSYTDYIYIVTSADSDRWKWSSAPDIA